MILKTAGIIMISTSAAVYGVFCSRRVKERALLLQEICTFIKNVEQGIRFGGKSLQETLVSCSFPLLNRSGFIDALKKDSLLRANAVHLLNDLENEEKEKLLSFLENVGKSHFCEKEINHCKLHLSYFEESAKNAENECRTKAELYKKLGIIGAVSCAVILL